MGGSCGGLCFGACAGDDWHLKPPQIPMETLVIATMDKDCQACPIPSSRVIIASRWTSICHKVPCVGQRLKSPHILTSHPIKSSMNPECLVQCVPNCYMMGSCCRTESGNQIPSIGSGVKLPEISKQASLGFT